MNRRAFFSWGLSLLAAAVLPTVKRVIALPSQPLRDVAVIMFYDSNGKLQEINLKEKLTKDEACQLLPKLHELQKRATEEKLRLIEIATADWKAKR